MNDKKRGNMKKRKRNTLESHHRKLKRWLQTLIRVEIIVIIIKVIVLFVASVMLDIPIKENKLLFFAIFLVAGGIVTVYERIQEKK